MPLQETPDVCALGDHVRASHVIHKPPFNGASSVVEFRPKVPGRPPVCLSVKCVSIPAAPIWVFERRLFRSEAGDPEQVWVRVD